MIIRTPEEFLQYLNRDDERKPYEYRVKVFSEGRSIKEDIDIYWSVFGCDMEDVESLYEYLLEHEE